MTGRRYPWMLVGLLWLVSAANSADRAVLVAVMPALRVQFGLGDTALALLNSLFFWVYAAAALFAGRLGDAWPRARVVLWALAFWSAATGLAPLAQSFALLLAARALVAAGEAPYYPAATALIGDWHRPAARSRALALHQTGVFAGAGLGALAAGLIADRFGWRAPFALFALLGLVLALAVARWLRDAPASGVRPPAEPYRLILANPAALTLCAVFFLSTGAASGLTVWAPTYVHDMLGTTLAGSALYGALPINLAGLVAVPIGGLIADRWVVRSAVGRFYTAGLGILLAALLLLPLPFATSAGGVAAVLLATTIGKGLFDGSVYAAAQDVIPPHARATAIGVMTTSGYLGAGIAPLFVAWLSRLFGMGVALGALAGAYLLATGLLIAMRRRIARAILAEDWPMPPASAIARRNEEDAP